MSEKTPEELEREEVICSFVMQYFSNVFVLVYHTCMFIVYAAQTLNSVFIYTSSI